MLLCWINNRSIIIYRKNVINYEVNEVGKWEEDKIWASSIADKIAEKVAINYIQMDYALD